MRRLKKLQVVSFSFIFILVMQFMVQGQESMVSGKFTKAEKEKFYKALRDVGTKDEDKDTWPIIESVFKSDEAGLRFLGIEILTGKAKTTSKTRTKIIPFLATVVMEDECYLIRGKAMHAIARYTEMDIVVKAITKMLTDEHKFNRQCAMEIITEKKITKAMPALKEAVVQEKDRILKGRMEETIALLKKWSRQPIEEKEDETDKLLKQLNDSDAQKRLIAAGQIQINADEFLGSEKAIETLFKAYEKESVRDNKLEMLGTLVVIGEENEKVISLLKRETSSKDAEIRDIAKKILEDIILNSGQ